MFLRRTQLCDARISAPPHQLSAPMMPLARKADSPAAGNALQMAPHRGPASVTILTPGSTQ